MLQLITNLSRKTPGALLHSVGRMTVGPVALYGGKNRGIAVDATSAIKASGVPRARQNEIEIGWTLGLCTG